MDIIKTKRLIIRPLTPNDTSFILELLNEPAFHKYIGDKGVRTETDALNYLNNGPIANYTNFGYGLYHVTEKTSGVSVGICGLKNRAALDIPDLGYAFLSSSWGHGYATEAGSAVVNYTKQHLNIDRIAAITHPENKGSIRVLEKIGFTFQKEVYLDDFEGPTSLFEIDLN
ncbi:GNAT family N-acetyltransferase [Fodinibius sp. Rm-B-1B1-1]|uniref:GNAT family N-acetyltransferase n=1 Tax=Fodinibius alkaliphilus TaxID=3140241 RepID=UPI00315A8A26